MKITKTIEGNTTTYYYDGVKKYKYCKNSNGFEHWKEYDANNNEIHSKDSDGFEYWKEYDADNNEIYYKNSNDFERWSEYNPNNPKNKLIEVEEEEVKPFEFN